MVQNNVEAAVHVGLDHRESVSLDHLGFLRGGVLDRGGGFGGGRRKRHIHKLNPGCAVLDGVVLHHERRLDLRLDQRAVGPPDHVDERLPAEDQRDRL